MTRITKQQIIKAAAAKTGIKAEYIELERNGSEGYFWAGKAGCVFSQSSTFTHLNAVSLERWIEDFESRVNDVMSACTEYSVFNEYIESIDWNVEFE